MQMPQPSAPTASPGALLDLSATGVRRHWSEHGVEKLITAMERCEPWAVDVRPEFRVGAETLVAQVAASFNAASVENITTSVSKDPALAVAFMGYLRSGRALALFAWLSQVHPDIPKYLINEARFGTDELGSILVERISALERQHLLSRVFSPERIALVIELLAEAGISAD